MDVLVTFMYKKYFCAAFLMNYLIFVVDERWLGEISVLNLKKSLI